VRVHLWWCVIPALVSPALQVERAGHAGMEVCDVSRDLVVRLTPAWLSRGLTPLEHAVRFGRDLGVIRPSTCRRIEFPWSSLRWGVPPCTWHRHHPSRERQGICAASRVRVTGDGKNTNLGPRVHLTWGTCSVLAWVGPDVNRGRSLPPVLLLCIL